MFSAVLALSACALALVAGSAAAAGFVAANEPTEANYTGIGKATLSYAGFSAECTVTVSGHMSESSESLAPSSTSIGECKAPATKFNGCSISKFDANGQANFGPSGCGPITSNTGVTTGDKIYLNETGSATYTNQGSGSTKTILATFSFGGSYQLGFPSKGELQSGAELKGSVTLSANQWGTQVAFEQRAETLTTLGVSASPLQFTSAHYPVNIHTANGWETKPIWTVRGTTIQCSKADYTTSGLSGATSTLTLAPEMGGCIYGGIQAAVFRNGCTNQFELTSTTGGIFKIVCAEGSGLEFLAYAKSSELAEGKYLCKMTIPAQSGTFTLTTSGGALKPKVSISKLKHTQIRASAFCPVGNGTFEDGSFAQEMKLAGSY
jgi:hypothetical protein